MTRTVEPTSARPWTESQWEGLFAEGFPAFIAADHEVKKHIGRVRELFGDLDVMLVEDDQPAATGWAVPVTWTGSPDDLPTSFADVLRRSVADRDEGREPSTLVICGGVVHPSRKGTGVAAGLVEALVETGLARGLRHVVAPVRPTHKHRYPLTPIAEYAAWTRPDDLPLDPWLRLHVRVGGRVIGLVPRAQTMTGTVAEWEAWTGLSLPASGRYVVPQGMSVLKVDLAADTGTYHEPNIWVQHR